MAANRFATMLHRNTNKITLILVYALLEWILIVLLLLNSLFTYLIIKFADFFGLSRPCLWCTRIDHIFDPAKGSKNMHRDLLCEVHRKEVSRLSYCSTHRKLVESHMCEDCSSSRPEFQGSTKDLAMKGLGNWENGDETVGENGGVSLNCSCCGVYLDDGRYSSYVLVKTSSWDVLERADEQNLITFDDDDDRIEERGDNSSEKVPDSAADELVVIRCNSEINENDTKAEDCFATNFDGMKSLKTEEAEVNLVFEVEREKDNVEEEKPILIMIDKSVQVRVEEDVQLEAPPQHLEFFLDFSGHTLVPIELMDSMSDEHHVKENGGIETGGDYEENDGIQIEGDDENKDQHFVLEAEAGVEEGEKSVLERGNSVEKVDAFLDVDINAKPAYSMLDAMEMEEDENSLVFHAKDSHYTTTEQFEAFPLARWPSVEASEVQEMEGEPVEGQSDDRADDVACEEVVLGNNETEADVSIGTEIPDLDITDDIQIAHSVHIHEHTSEDPSTSSANLYTVDDDGPTEVDVQMVELHTLSVQDREISRDSEASFQLEVNEIEEDKFPDTPTSVDSLNQLHKKLLMLEKRDSGTEESLDGSVTSELEGNDGVVTVERLKAALRAERKTLQALYAELEEERSASAVAANQTMAMINRLQEEKAAMQMEALQYQRMMEEQSEYDQEALQLLNELMVKREKEKEELERELDGYRMKLLEYETKEKIKTLRKSKDGSSRSVFSSASCSNAEDSDGLSIDLNQEAKEENGFYSNQNTPVDAVVNLEQSLADFEEERMSILEQLKVLEEKLLSLDEDENEHFEDVESIDNIHDVNSDCVDENGHLNGGETNGHANGGYPKELMNGKHHQSRRIAGQKGKSLLPLFDAICDENGDDFLNGNGVHDSYESKFELENKKLAIEEEVDHLYERLQALEADREFLKHCINSLQKGDKGMDLLQEILQHLRDLRNVELRVKNLGDNAII